MFTVLTLALSALGSLDAIAADPTLDAYTEDACCLFTVDKTIEIDTDEIADFSLPILVIDLNKWLIENSEQVEHADTTRTENDAYYLAEQLGCDVDKNGTCTVTILHKYADCTLVSESWSIDADIGLPEGIEAAFPPHNAYGEDFYGFDAIPRVVEPESLEFFNPGILLAGIDEAGMDVGLLCKSVDHPGT